MQPVSTATLYTQTINEALTVQTNLSTAETQEASGLMSQDFGGLGGSGSRVMLNFESDIAQAQGWSSQAQTVGATTQAMYNAIGNMDTAVNSVQTLISQAMSSPNNSDLLNQAQAIRAELLTQTNQQVGGSYLFAGSNSAVPPVSLAHYPTLNAGSNAYDPNTADTRYYTGDNQLQSVQVNLEQSITYGVTAQDPAIEAAMRAVQSVVEAAQVSSNSTLTATDTTSPSSASGGTLQINNQTFNIAGGLSLDQIATSINSQAGSSGISASVLPDSSGAYHLQVSDGMNALAVTDNSGLGLASASTSPSQLTSLLQNSLTLANQAQSGLAKLQENVANTSNQLSSAQTTQTSFVTYLQNSLSGVKDVDAAQAASQVQLYQTQLQASYMAVATISKLSLVTYL
jgi:flagellar hook-associated protein 3 FlgL